LTVCINSLPHPQLKSQHLKFFEKKFNLLAFPDKHYIVPEHLASTYGLNSRMAKLSPKAGGGIPVLFEFEHHLHCLNLIRQTSKWNYDYYLALGKGAFKNSEDVVHAHFGHCVDILRQQLMCQPDTGVFGSYWVKSVDGVFVDFNTEHKCKNFGELRDWVGRHQVDEKKLGLLEVVKRPGDLVLDDIP
jgi:hypothetical protein